MGTKINEIDEIKLELKRDLRDSFSSDSVDQLNTKYLGKQGKINTLFKTLPVKTDPKIGRQINELKNLIQEMLSAKLTETMGDEQHSIDVTIPGTEIPRGSLHLVTQAIEEIETIFLRLGFVRRRYPEVETDWYYAEGLNIPKEHPARDDQETFYVGDNTVLTAHTSNGQLREMELKKSPPIKMINIGKTYRRQIDASHTPMFHQFEGLVIDKEINITNLLGVTEYFAKSYFGQDRRTRLRPHHFQFTEPSFEIDVTCGVCQGTGVIHKIPCKVCKSGWLELGGAGMVHPNVLRNGGLNPDECTGFAFGWGVERVLMMKSNLPDLRLIYSDDIRFLKQF
ncbi:MAG: Phenylalanine-tRNA ligase alpha subunit [Microgenomates group bacterium GW2011_GWC1_44_37]|uniref:Phenylalanine--tRNA ligase alpha subunit n=1 Tax=Candidatus Collierbacteria bacterium GW2011_GWB2_44_22 TaxID=1618387 RepID=A0A0G1KVP5_9BACT|nr:MAG: Phenylalanine-tRNA ligase alpha subunit [Candidatus Collierbacteria bacterium GW2011_GWA2_44_13]KKT51553.1 MAG: Phenylalanine-tRNA ligase alpha subunit [Candidatus Collierbacteria bacterium GW2011_GWB1_44_197]KKT51994.1 MAG: Phenylalanine-tRNA ligase alpha subunit [Candidatus Collierbacteria bacterium GW2011_GWB2_44_22]KKT62148.1 MAG: Phenylalanine-tRNA ligase alpha subunit [Candidatus Collierbacteria bacterium GW2011_GWD1_44_27]KKT66718.1 MAG: Phenylalanine-tRNA ligase alpha subunit [C